jgi:hypothetical protein
MMTARLVEMSRPALTAVKKLKLDWDNFVVKGIHPATKLDISIAIHNNNSHTNGFNIVN